MMHSTVKVIVGLAAAGMVGGVPAAATSAGRTAKASKSAKARRAGSSYFGATANTGGMTIVLSSDRRHVRRTLFAFQTTCTDGTTQYDYESLVGIPIAGRTFKGSFDSGPQTDPKAPGVTVQKTHSITGVISKRGSKIVGTARVTLMITKDAVSIKCDTGLVPFAATD